MPDDQHTHTSGDEHPDGGANRDDTGRQPAARPAWWRPARYTARTRVAAVTLVVVIAAAVTTFLLIRSEPDTLTPTRLAHDPVPKLGRTITGKPELCGVTEATLDELMPRHSTLYGGAHDTSKCLWTHENDKRMAQRELQVKIHLTEPQPSLGSRLEAAPPAVAVAMGRYADAGTVGKDGVLAVHGLGDEAKIWYEDHHGATAVTRVRNAVVTVDYSGRNNSKSLPRKTAFTGAMRAAADVAKSLGSAHRPEVADAVPVPAKAPITRDLTTCDLIPTARAATLLDDDSVQPEATQGIDTDDGQSKSGTCTWETDHDTTMTLAVDRYPDSVPGSGTRAARRSYLERYISMRAAEPISDTDERYFTPLRGLGEQAFAGFVAESLPARVTLRERNVVIRITYTSSDDDHPLSRQDAVSVAYTAASVAADALPKPHGS